MPFYRSVLENSSGGGGGGGEQSPYVTISTTGDMPIMDEFNFAYYNSYSEYDVNVFASINNVTIGNAVNGIYYMFGYKNSFNANIDCFNATNLTNMSSLCEDAYEFNSNIIFPNNINVVLDDEYSISFSCSGMLSRCYNFDKPINFRIHDICTNNETPSYADFSGVFSNCNKFNSQVVFDLQKYQRNSENYELDAIQYQCRLMFENCFMFNQPVRFPAGLQDIEMAFQNCFNFNQPVVFDLYGMGYYTYFTNLFKDLPNMCSDIVFFNSNHLIAQTNMFGSLVNNSRSNTINIYIDNVAGIKSNNLTGQGSITWTESSSPYGYTTYSNSAYKIQIIDNEQYGLDKFNNYYNNFYNI